MSEERDISVIATTLDEAAGILNLLRAIQEQAVPPRELILIDGGSTDDTVERIESRRAALAERGIELRVQVEPGAGIARGRNLGVNLARHERIATVDGGAIPHPDWLRAIVAGFAAGADLVGGFAVPETDGPVEEAIARILFPRRHRPGYLPSSRSFGFTKEAWRRAGGYPEALPWGEDTRFVLDCLAAGARLEYAEEAIVTWDGRKDVKSLLRQQYRYGVGDGMARHASFANLLAVLVLVVIAGLVLYPLHALVVLGAIAAFYAVRRRYGIDLPGLLAALLSLPVAVARGLGFLRGLGRKGAR